MTEKEFNDLMLGDFAGRTSTSSTNSDSFFSIELLQKAMLPIMEALDKPDEMVIWMKANGCDPDLGWVLMVPLKDNVWSPLTPPWYVRVSPVVPEICLIYAPLLSPPRLKPVEPLKYVFDWRI